MHRQIPALFDSLRLSRLAKGEGNAHLSPAFCASFVSPYKGRDRIFSGLHVTIAHPKDDECLRSNLLRDMARSDLLMYGTTADQLQRCAFRVTWPAVHVRAHGSAEELEAKCVHNDVHVLDRPFTGFNAFTDPLPWWRNCYVSEVDVGCGSD